MTHRHTNISSIHPGTHMKTMYFNQKRFGRECCSYVNIVLTHKHRDTGYMSWVWSKHTPSMIEAMTVMYMRGFKEAEV